MTNMFTSATSFNGDISKWDVSSVTKMDRMFYLASSFKQTLCLAPWVNSKATKTLAFEGTSGSISQTGCTSAPTPASTLVTPQYVSHQPLPERELIVRTSAVKSTLAKTVTCPKCGTFEKSGRTSCCAAGGAWFKNCGGAGNVNVGHRWFEGVEACKRKLVKA